jgi:hypothetical protein
MAAEIAEGEEARVLDHAAGQLHQPGDAQLPAAVAHREQAELAPRGVDGREGPAAARLAQAGEGALGEPGGNMGGRGHPGDSRAPQPRPRTARARAARATAVRWCAAALRASIHRR